MTDKRAHISRTSRAAQSPTATSDKRGTKARAHCWQKANGFPGCVRKYFERSEIELFKHMQPIISMPEHNVPLPPQYSPPSQTAPFVVAKSDSQLVAIAVEEKVSQRSGVTTSQWNRTNSFKKQMRISFLCNELQLRPDALGNINYQFLHRTAAALVEAERFKARHALMLVHSFSRSCAGFKEYRNLLSLYGVEGKFNSVVFAKNIRGIDLYFGWVQGGKGIFIEIRKRGALF